MKKWYGSAVLLLAAVIWGFSFVAQSVGMEYVGPFTFQAVRSLVGSAALVPVILVMDARRKKAGVLPPSREDKARLWKAGILCGLVLCVACSFQQVGILYTSVGKAGFLTSMYLVLVPILGIFFHRRAPLKIWFCVAACAVGIYLMSMTGMLAESAAGANIFAKGDGLVIVCAFFYAIHILVIDRLAPGLDGVRLSCIQFLVSGLLSTVIMFAVETPSFEGIFAAGTAILFSGVMSCAGGYTLQIIGQQYTEPTVATLLLSLESVFSMVGGVLLLHQIPSLRELLGCVLVFAAVVLAQLPVGERREG